MDSLELQRIPETTTIRTLYGRAVNPVLHRPLSSQQHCLSHGNTLPANSWWYFCSHSPALSASQSTSLVIKLQTACDDIWFWVVWYHPTESKSWGAASNFIVSNPCKESWRLSWMWTVLKCHRPWIYVVPPAAQEGLIGQQWPLGHPHPVNPWVHSQLHTRQTYGGLQSAATGS